MAPRPMTVREIVSQASIEIGTAQRPATAVINSSDQDLVQMYALLCAVGDEVVLEEPYKTALGDGFWALGADGLRKGYPNADSDMVLFDRRLAIEGVKYRFLKAKGLEHGEELREFTVRLNKLAARANGRLLDLDEDESVQL